MQAQTHTLRSTAAERSGTAHWRTVLAVFKLRIGVIIALTANVMRIFDGFSANFSTQGGTASNCGMPNGVAALPRPSVRAGSRMLLNPPTVPSAGSMLVYTASAIIRRIPSQNDGMA